MRAIKALVIFMGILLIAGLGLVGYGLYSKAGKLSKTPADQTAVTAPAPPSGAEPVAEGGFGTQTIPLPPGSRVEAMNSAANRVILHIAGPDGSRLVIVNPVNGAVTGTVLLKPDAASGGDGAPR